MSARASGIGSLPGEDLRGWLRVVMEALPDLPHLPELPDRGAIADVTGRALATVGDLGFDLQPAGWRLTDAPGVDHRRARSLLAQDLDVLEEVAQGYDGTLKVQVAGPWTVAARVEKPRGDKVLSDHGARRELAQALAEGVRTHVADVHRRVPGASLVLQVDEPTLPFVLAGQVPTASGFGRHRVVHPPEASEALAGVLEAAGEARTVVHCCAPAVPVALLRGAGAGGVSVDLAVLEAGEYDALGTVLDEGGEAWLGVVPFAPATTPTTRSALDRARRLLDMLGLDPEEVADRVVLTPACGLAGGSSTYARAVLGAVREAAAELG